MIVHDHGHHRISCMVTSGGVPRCLLFGLACASTGLGWALAAHGLMSNGLIRPPAAAQGLPCSANAREAARLLEKSISQDKNKYYNRVHCDDEPK